MKKFLLILLLFLITGCSQPQFNGAVKDVKINKLKVSSSDILYSKDIDYIKCKNKVCDNLGKIKKYYYKGEEVATGTLKIKGKNLKEDVSKRTLNTRFYQDGQTKYAEIYSLPSFIKDNGKWKNVEVATATIKSFDNAELLGASGDPIYTTNDGTLVYTGSATWSEERNRVNASGASGATLTLECEKYNGGSKYYLSRAVLSFAIPAGITISSGDIYLYGSRVVNNGENSVGISGCSSYGSLDVSDYSKVNDTLKSNTTISINSWNLSGYNDFPLNSSGISDVQNNTGGTVAFAYRNYTFDILNVSPFTVVQNNIDAYSSAEAGTTKDPKLIITYTDTPPPVNNGQIIIIE